MKQEVLIGQTDYTVLVKIRDTAGAPATGLDEADIDIAYARVETDNDVTTADVTPAALTALTDAHTDWGFEEVSATDHPGLYRLDIADAVFASGAWSAVVSITGTGLDPTDLEFVLIAFNPRDGVRLGLTALPNAAADAAGGLPISDAGGLDLDTLLGRLDAAVSTRAAAAKLLAYFQLALRSDAGIATDNATELGEINADEGSGAGSYDNTDNPTVILADAAHGGASATITADITGDVTGSLSGSVGSVTGNVGGNVTGSVGSVTGAVGSVTGNVGGNVTGSIGSLAAQAKADVNAEADSAIETYHLDHLFAADYDPSSKPGTATALLNELVENDGGVSRFTANALEQAPSAPTADQIADAVWEEALADHEGTEGSTAEALATAGGSGASAGDIADAVLDEALAGHTTAGTLGKAIADTLADTNELQTAWADGGRLDLILDARASQASVDDVPTVSEFNARTLVAASYATAANQTTIISDIGSVPTAAENATAILAAGDVDGYSLEETLKLCLAALSGKLSGAATATVTIRAADDSKARITATVDSDGNRSAVTLDAAG